MDYSGVIIESERLRIVPIQVGHAPDYLAHYTEDVACFMTPRPYHSRFEAEAYIRFCISHYQAGLSLQCVALDRLTGEFLGSIGLYGLISGTPEIGIWFKEAAQSHGYGLEAVRAVIGWARENIDFAHILYPVDARNLRSRSIPERLGGYEARAYEMVSETGKALHVIEYHIE